MFGGILNATNIEPYNCHRATPYLRTDREQIGKFKTCKQFPSYDTFFKAHYFNYAFHIFINMYSASKFTSVMKYEVHNEIHSHNNEFVFQLLTDHTFSINQLSLFYFRIKQICAYYSFHSLPLLVFSYIKKKIFDFSLTVKAVPHECVIRTGQP